MKGWGNMMNLQKVKWWKAVLMLALTAFFLYVSVSTVPLLRHYYSDWIVNKGDALSRAYSALTDILLSILTFVMFVSCFIASLRSLVHCFFPPKKPSLFARLAIRYRWRPALISFVVFLVLLAIEIILGNIIVNTPEAGEVPATLFERQLSGCDCIAMLLAFEATIVMFVSWLQNRSVKN